MIYCPNFRLTYQLQSFFVYLKPDSCKRQEWPLETKSILNISSHHWEAFDRCMYNSGLWQIPFIYYSMLSVVVHSENLTFRSVDKTPVGELSNFQPLSSTVSYTVQGGSNFQVCGKKPGIGPFIWKLLSSTFMWYCLLCCKGWFFLFYMDKALVFNIHLKYLSTTFMWYFLQCWNLVCGYSSCDNVY